MSRAHACHAILKVPLLLFVLAAPAAAQPCNTTPVALDDEAAYIGGPVVVDVLANDSEPDGEALTVGSLSTTCPGTVSEDLGLVTLFVSGEMPEECMISYEITDERGASATASVTVEDNTEIFSDGFESGDTSLWTLEE